MSAIDYKINLNHPINSRNWLSIMRPDDNFGLNFYPHSGFNDRKKVGFTFKSNKFGFHGNSNTHANGVILGTSFGMGMSVDEGNNWFQLNDSIQSNFLNLSMPVSPFHHQNSLNKIYRGNFNKLIYIYHPNTWKVASNFYRAMHLGKDIFSFSHWETSYSSLLKLIPKWYLKRFIYKILSIEGKFSEDAIDFRYNTRYNYFDLSKTLNLLDFKRSVKEFHQIFEQFSSVYVFRIPIKEQIINKKVNIIKLSKLCQNYEDNWNLWLKDLSKIQSNITVYDMFECGNLQLKDFHPNDTHLSLTGNEKVSNIISNVIKI